MNRSKLLLIAALFLIVNVRSQVTVGKVSYRRILNLDSAEPVADSVGTRALLYFKQGQSMFIYNSALINKDDTTTKATSDPNTLTLEQGDKYGESVFTDHLRNKICIRELVWKKGYLTEEPIPVIEWIIEKEEKYFGRIVCHKATANFRGRTYTAWFTYDIPVDTGPWKLQGLPGLILEASDLKKEVQFKFESIEIPTREAISFQPPAKGKKVALSDFRQLWVKETAKLQKFFQSTAEKGVTVDMDSKYYPIEKSFE